MFEVAYVWEKSEGTDLLVIFIAIKEYRAYHCCYES